MTARAEGDRLDLNSLPDLNDEWARLEAYRRANEEEKAMVKAALAKAPADRTIGEQNIIAYSRFGTAAGCGCQ